MTERSEVRKKKYFVFRQTPEEICRKLEKTNLIGRKPELGDVFIAQKHLMLYGTKMHIGSFFGDINIPLSVSDDVGNVFDAFGHLFDEKVNLFVTCRTTDRSVMMKIGEQPNCYWDVVYCRVADGIVMSAIVEFFKIDAPVRGYFGESYKKSISKQFEDSCSLWYEMLAVVVTTTRDTEFERYLDTALHKGHQKLVTPSVSLTLEANDTVEFHFGPIEEIITAQKYFKDNLNLTCKYTELCNDHTKKFFLEQSKSLVITEDNRRVCESTLNVKLKEHNVETTKGMYFNQVIVDVCIALANFHISNYEIKEVISLLPGMQHCLERVMMKRIFKVNQSIVKVREKRSEINKTINTE